METRKVVSGDQINLAVDLGKTRAGQKYFIEVKIEKPNGTVESRSFVAQIVAPISRDK